MKIPRSRNDSRASPERACLSRTGVAIAAIVGAFIVFFAPAAFSRDRPAPTGPQTDGAFHKVVLDPVGNTDFISDLSQLLREPMELAVDRKSTRLNSIR